LIESTSECSNVGPELGPVPGSVGVSLGAIFGDKFGECVSVIGVLLGSLKGPSKCAKEGPLLGETLGDNGVLLDSSVGALLKFRVLPSSPLGLEDGVSLLSTVGSPLALGPEIGTPLVGE